MTWRFLVDKIEENSSGKQNLSTEYLTTENGLFSPENSFVFGISLRKDRANTKLVVLFLGVLTKLIVHSNYSNLINE